MDPYSWVYQKKFMAVPESGKEGCCLWAPPKTQLWGLRPFASITYRPPQVVYPTLIRACTGKELWKKLSFFQARSSSFQLHFWQCKCINMGQRREVFDKFHQPIPNHSIAKVPRLRQHVQQHRLHSKNPISALFTGRLSRRPENVQW